MSDEIQRAAIALYDRFTHEGMDRRAFMAELSRIAGGGRRGRPVAVEVAADRELQPQIAADDRRFESVSFEWEFAPGPPIGATALRRRYGWARRPPGGRW